MTERNEQAEPGDIVCQRKPDGWYSWIVLDWGEPRKKYGPYPFRLWAAIRAVVAS